MFGSNMTDEWVSSGCTTNDPLRLAIFSGSGSGMAALLDHQKNKTCSHQTVVAVTDKSNADGISVQNKGEYQLKSFFLPTKPSLKKTESFMKI